MENTPKRLLLNTHCKNNDGDDVAETTTSSSKIMDSPKTPVRPTLDDSLEGYETEEMESPQFRHLIPVYHKAPNEYDLEGVRIGWDDGCGSVCFQDDDYGSERRFKKRKRNVKLFSEQSPVFGPQKFNNTSSQNISSPSSRHYSSRNNAVIQTELNEYLECILSCLSAKKKNRQLLKSKNDSNSIPSSSSVDNINSLLNDSSDELMILCSQAIEKKIAIDANFNTMNTAKDNSLSILGISPLPNTNNTVNSNLYNHTITNFKHIEDKPNENEQFQCDTNGSSVSQNNTNINKDDLASEDYLFSTIDLAAIEQQIFSNVEKPSPVSTTQICNKLDNKSGFNTNSVFRRTASSSNVSKQLNFQQDDKSFNGTNSGIVNSKTTGRRYCTPSEIAVKKQRARRTLMLKFKSKNKSA